MAEGPPLAGVEEKGLVDGNTLAAIDPAKLESQEELHGIGPYDPVRDTRFGGWFSGQAGTFWDGVLTTCTSQIGQILLTLPNAYAKLGLTAGLILSVSCGTMSLWTMYMLITLYVERKYLLISKGLWLDKQGQRLFITQYHEVIGDLLGLWAKYTVQVVIIVSLMGTCVAQIVACASDVYYFSDVLNKRNWAFIFGGACMFTVLLPTLRHFRLINVIALFCTTWTAWYIVITAGSYGVAPGAAGIEPVTLENFYTGASTLFSAFGGHAMALEIMDAMFKPERYSGVYFLSYFYVFTLTVPHSVATQLAFPKENLANGNVFGVLPNTTWRKVSITLMLFHQLVAFALYSAPLYYMWEKILGIHSKPLWIRCPLRLPVAAIVFFIALAFPFYNTLNAIVGAFTSPAIAFMFPALAYCWFYRTAEARRISKFPPPRWMLFMGGTWGFIWILNAFVILFFLVNGTGFGLYYSTKQFVADVNQYQVFAACYQCPKT